MASSIDMVELQEVVFENPQECSLEKSLLGQCFELLEEFYELRLDIHCQVVTDDLLSRIYMKMRELEYQRFKLFENITDAQCSRSDIEIITEIDGKMIAEIESFWKEFENAENPPKWRINAEDPSQNYMPSPF